MQNSVPKKVTIDQALNNIIAVEKYRRMPDGIRDHAMKITACFDLLLGHYKAYYLFMKSFKITEATLEQKYPGWQLLVPHAKKIVKDRLALLQRQNIKNTEEMLALLERHAAAIDKWDEAKLMEVYDMQDQLGV